jgi:NADH:ubiquinone oxidoreductase subunit 4 (subunit M)
VLAAMYMLRLISAVLHGRQATAADESVLDLRPAELAIVVPLLVLLLALSAWPAAISDHMVENSGDIPVLAELTE